MMTLQQACLSETLTVLFKPMFTLLQLYALKAHHGVHFEPCKSATLLHASRADSAMMWSPLVCSQQPVLGWPEATRVGH